MAQRRMADVVGEGERLYQVFVEREGPRERPGDARHFQRVRQPAAVVVAVVAGEDLGLVGKPAEGRGVHDPVAVTLVGAAELVWGLGMDPAGRVDAMHRPGGEQELLPGLPVGLAPAGGGHGCGSAATVVSWSQSASSACGSTRIPATDGMKLTSPLQRGTTCQWR